MAKYDYWASLKVANAHRQSNWIGRDYIQERRCVCGCVNCPKQGKCHCGCGMTTSFSYTTQGTSSRYTKIAGLSSLFIKGHGSRLGIKNSKTVLLIDAMTKEKRCICGTVDCAYYSFCHCGCGEAAPLAGRTQTDGRGGRYAVSGLPVRFISSHLPQRLPGQDNSGYKGHRIFVPSRGYWYVWQPDHPRALKNRIPEHVYVMEQHLGRYLHFTGRGKGDSEVVHHINEDSTDNRIENLRLMTVSEHISLHRKGEMECL